MIKFREHRGTLAESLTTQVELETHADLIIHLQKLWPNMSISEESIEIRPWAFDIRVKQQLSIVLHRTQPGVLGFTYTEPTTLNTCLD